MVTAVTFHYTVGKDADFQSLCHQIKWCLLHLWLTIAFWIEVRRLWRDPFWSWEILFEGDVVPLSARAPLGIVLTLPPLPGWKQSQAQWNNCTKYSPAVTIETSAGASLTSPTVFSFCTWPRKTLGAWCLVSSQSTFSAYRWYNQRAQRAAPRAGSARGRQCFLEQTKWRDAGVWKGERGANAHASDDARGAAGRGNLQWQQNRAPLQGWP